MSRHSIPTVFVLTAALWTSLLAGPPAVIADEPPENAALQYWQAFHWMPRFLEDGVDDATTTEKIGVPVDAELAKHIRGKRGEWLKYLHRGAMLSHCEWGIDLRADGIDTLLPHLDRSRDLMRYSLLRARWRFEHGEWDKGIDDVIATMVLGRHVGRDKIPISNFSGYILGHMSIWVAAAYLPEMPPPERETLLRRLDTLPPYTPMRDGVLNDRKMLDWIIANVERAEKEDRLPELVTQLWPKEEAKPVMEKVRDGKALLKLCLDAYPLCGECAELMALSPDKFDQGFKKRIESQFEENPVAELLCSTWPMARRAEVVAECRLAMLRAAIDVLARGEAALEGHPEPFGDGPFTYTEFEGGFQLSTKRFVYVGGKPITFDFGIRRDVKP